jgi:hypothetical protein
MIAIWIVIALLAAGDAAVSLPDSPTPPPATASVDARPEAVP